MALREIWLAGIFSLKENRLIANCENTLSSGCISPERDLLLIIVGTAIFTVGILSIFAHFASSLKKERILLWFGLFAAPYGCALLLRSILLPDWDQAADLWLIVFGKLIGFSAGIPALLLFREFYGSGRHLSSRWILWIYGGTVTIVLVMMALHEQARAIPSPGLALVLIIPVALLFDHFAGYRPPPIPGQRSMFAGLFIFFASFSYDHLVALKLGMLPSRMEPFGFLILIACIGQVVARRVRLNEAEWISMSGEMHAARRIQEAILPSEMPILGDWTISACYSPMSSVAGDFYGFPKGHPDSLNVIVADVMGHGVPAALIASMIKVSVFAGAEKLESAPAILSDLNSTLCKDAPGQYASALFVSLDRQSGIGRYTSAGHPPPLLRRRKAKRIDRLDQSGMLLGVVADQIYQETVFSFDQGDRLLLYSDGLTEPENPAGISFGDGSLLDLLEGADYLTTEQLARALLQAVRRWPGKGLEDQQTDDITLVVIDLGQVEKVAASAAGARSPQHQLAG